MANKVAPERTGWRDENISRWHRLWGIENKAIDIDFPLIEHSNDYGDIRLAALIEYKNEHAKIQYPSQPQYKVLCELANPAELPAYAVRYADDFNWLRIVPLNSFARKYLPKMDKMTECQYVQFLYKLRGYDEIPQDVLETIRILK